MFSTEHLDLLSWTRPASTAPLFITLNLFFLLVTWFNFGIISLLFLFIFTLFLLGISLNLLYKASNDGGSEEQAEARNDDEVEFVSTDFIQVMLISVYKMILYVRLVLRDIFSFKDPRLTAKTSIFMAFIYLLTWIISDMAILHLLTIFILTWPIAYKTKKTQLDAIFAKINEPIDKMVPPAAKKSKKDQWV